MIKINLLVIIISILGIVYLTIKEIIKDIKAYNSNYNYLSPWQEIKLGYNQYKATSSMPQFIVDFENSWYSKTFNVIGFICVFIVLLTINNYSNFPFAISDSMKIPAPLFIKIISFFYSCYKTIWSIIKLIYLFKQILRNGLIVINSKVRYMATFINIIAHGYLIIILIGFIIWGVVIIFLTVDYIAENLGIIKPLILRKLTSPILDRILSEDALFMKTMNIVNFEEENIRGALKKYLNASNDVSRTTALNYYLKVKANSIVEIDHAYSVYIKRFPNALMIPANEFMSYNPGENLVTKIQKEELLKL